jgi:NAD(P)-dependent dehydrogenase (short-subunit alcohol dehydrogenase family)
MDLTGKVALITGTKRIGSVVAGELAAHGADVAISYGRSKSEAEQTAERVRTTGRRVSLFQTDLTDAASCQKLVAEAAASLGRLDVLVHMASVYKQRPFAEMTPADFDGTLAVDLRAAFILAQAAVPHMRTQRGGRIILFSDWLPRSGRPRYQGFLAYYVAKGGVIALTEALALELAADNILVNAVAPGPILAPPDTTADDHQKVADATPLGRWGGELEIAKAVLGFIEQDFVTGETFRVDGGRHVK